VSRYGSVRLACAALLTVGALVAPAADAKPRTSFDYTRVKGLSADRYDVVREKFAVPMSDGVKLHIEVVHPDVRGRFGTILKLSPYHGVTNPLSEDRDGDNILPKTDSLVNYFAPRGYAVAFADLRGTGLSEGCLDHMGKLDQKDAYAVVEWLAKRPWSNGRVGMIGISYPGSTPILAAAQRPPHLSTIVPIAGLSRMYDHQFQQGVPYNAQWLGPAGAYDAFSVERHLEQPVETGRNAGCGLTQNAALNGDAFTSGAETAWHRERDFRAKATAAKIPVFMVHGVNDGSVRTPTMDWFTARRRPGDKIWLGQWGHNHPPRDDQWVRALHAWFDKHLSGRRVQTGPAVELFLNDGQVAQPASWPVRTGSLALYTAPGGDLTSRATGEATTVSYVADGRGYNAEFSTGNVAFDAPPVKVDTLIAGVPTLRLVAAVTAPRVHLIATLYDVNGSVVDRIGQAAFAVQPELRDGIAKPKAVPLGEAMTISLRGMVQAHVLKRGHHLRLVIASSHPDKIPSYGNGAQVTVTVGGQAGTRVVLPVIERPRLLADVYDA